jgi:hypothetical protein
LVSGASACNLEEAISLMFDRSLEYWQAGVRTRECDLPPGLWPVVWGGTEMSEVLVSNYCQAEYTVLTTATDQYLLYTDEMPQGQALKAHGKTKAKPWSGEAMGRKPSWRQGRDGQNRGRMGL